MSLSPSISEARGLMAVERKIRVLVVDDSAVARKLISDALKQSGDIEVAGCAADGYSAYEQIALLRPDVLTLDIEMPGMDGLTLARLVKGDARLARVPVVALTAFAKRGDEERLLPLCAQRAVAYLAFGPLSGGWLTGKYRRGEPFPAASRMTQRPEPYERLVSEHTFDALERLETLAWERRISMAGLSLAWLLSDERVGQVVVGPGRPEHLEPVREALAAPLSVAERDELSTVFS